MEQQVFLALSECRQSRVVRLASAGPHSRLPQSKRASYPVNETVLAYPEQTPASRAGERELRQPAPPTKQLQQPVAIQGQSETPEIRQRSAKQQYALQSADAN